MDVGGGRERRRRSIESNLRAVGRSATETHQVLTGEPGSAGASGASLSGNLLDLGKEGGEAARKG
jgi:hypothetical protein